MTLALLQVFPKPQPRPKSAKKVRGSAMQDDDESIHARVAREYFDANKDEFREKMRAARARKK